MKQILKKILINALYYSGIPLLIRESVLRNKVTIILLHDISPLKAERLFEWLSRSYNIIDLRTFINASLNDKTEGIPEKAMIITFDDGHSGNYKLLPIIEKYNIPITIFLCSGIVDTNRNFWFRYIEDQIPTDSLKIIPNQERLRILAGRGFEQEMEFSTPQSLTKAQIEVMKNLVNFQSHTVFHPCLTQCDDEESRLEITRSKEMLQENFKLEINTIAFPNGDYTEREIRFAKEAGYKCALTVKYGFNSLNSDMFRLKRISINDEDSIATAALKTAGIWGLLKRKLDSR